MSDPHPRPPGASITPLLAGAALVLAGYLVLDRFGVFEPAPTYVSRAIQPRGDLAQIETTTIKIFEDNSPSAVHISTTHTVVDRLGRERGTSRATGSGIVWDEQGHILTNNHVIAAPDGLQVRDGDSIKVEILVRLQTSKTYRAEEIFTYPYLDMAVVRLVDPPRHLRPALIGQSKDLKVGQSVFAIGNPFGLEQTLTTGIISALNRSINTGHDVELDGVIQVDAAINPGNSGGLLLDSAGRLIGMNTAIYSQTGESAGIGFAVPIDRIRPMVPRMLARQPPVDAGLGVRPRNWPYPLGRELGYGYGILVAEANPGGGAADAGIRSCEFDSEGNFRSGDVVVRADGERIETTNGLYRILEKHKSGDKIDVVIARFESGVRSYRLIEKKVELKPLFTTKR